MKWKRAKIVPRLICLVLGVACFGMARHLLHMSKAGIEDVPPPFILVSGLVGIAFLFVAIIGRYPWRDRSGHD